MAILHPLECYLLELFSSPGHFAETRDAIIKWLDAHESAYAREAGRLDPRQRNKPMWKQGDVVWGQRVLPNIRFVRDFYSRAYIMRVNNDPLAFKAGHAMASNNRGMYEFWWGWMTEKEQQQISNLCAHASHLDWLLGDTNSAEWEEGQLTYRKINSVFEGFIAPKYIPRYMLDFSVRVEAGENPTEIGIYLPDVEYASAQLLYPSNRMGGEKVRQGVLRGTDVSPETGKIDYSWKESRVIETGWTLIRRVEGEYIAVPSEGFFPRGEPDELYSWPERESQYICRDSPHISAMSGEVASHTGKWAYTGRNSIEYCDLQQGQYLPERAGEVIKWTLILRSDGGSCLE